MNAAASVTPIPVIISINISSGGIPKTSVESVKVNVSGLEGDGHDHEKHYRPIQAVCLQDIEKLEELAREGYDVVAGSTGENLTVRHLHVNALPLGTLLRFSGGVVLEVSKVRQPCYVLDSIDPKLKDDIIGRCGQYARVIQDGMLHTQDTIMVTLPSHF